MKNKIKFGGGTLIVILLASCSSINQPLIELAAQEANTVALDIAIKNPAERTQIASYEFAAATAARSLSGGEALTPEAFKTYVSTFFPQTATFADLASSITSVYASYFPQIKGNPKAALQILEAIAQGVENSAQSIISPNAMEVSPNQ